MIRLLGVELTRFRSRRAVALLLLAGVLITAVIAGATAWNTRGVSESELRYAQELAQSEAEQPSFQEELADCQQNADDWGVTVDECEDIVLPSASWYLDRSPLDLERERTNSALGAATVLAGLAIMIGATFAGADWASGSMSNQLLFEPRRARMWLAKAIVVVLGTALLALVALSALWAFYSAVVSARDLTTTGDALGPIRGDVLRAVAVCAAAGLGGLALSMFFRSTVATVAVTFVVTVAGEILLNLLPIEGRMRFSPSLNLMAVLQDGAETYDSSLRCDPTVGDCGMLQVSLAGGAAYLGVLLAVVALVSLWSFRRRDVP